jgi:hypothetical protein
LVCAFEDAETSLHLGKVDPSPFDATHASFITSLQVTRNRELYWDYEMDDLSKFLDEYQSKRKREEVEQREANMKGH